MCSFCQGAIDARSSKPPVKEDDVERKKRRASAEKHKSMQDTEKKKEKRKNLERQALEDRRAKAKREGCLRRTLPMKTMMTMTTTTIMRGWRLVSIESYRAHRKPTFPRRARGLPRDCKAEIVTGTKKRHCLAVRVPTCPLPPPRVGPFFCHDPPSVSARPSGQDLWNGATDTRSCCCGGLEPGSRASEERKP